MENLNKENFWNALMGEYPEAVQYFCDWIDKYKVEVGWDKLFGNASGKPGDPGIPVNARAIKFHDIPIDMQNGIIARFELELFYNKNGEGHANYEKIMGAYKGQVANIFKDLQSQINERKKSLN